MWVTEKLNCVGIIPNGICKIKATDSVAGSFFTLSCLEIYIGMTYNIFMENCVANCKFEKVAVVPETERTF